MPWPRPDRRGTARPNDQAQKFWNAVLDAMRPTPFITGPRLGSRPITPRAVP